MKKLIVLGASSDMVKATVKNMQNIDAVCLLHRKSDPTDIKILEESYSAFHIENSFCIDFTDPITVVNNVLMCLDTDRKRYRDVCIIYGAAAMADDDDAGAVAESIAVNFSTPALLAHSICSFLRNHSTLTFNELQLVFFSSVSSSRGKMSTLTYSAAKAGVDKLFEGLQCLERETPCFHITLVRPGFVSTKMLTKATPKFLTIDEEDAGLIIADGIQAKQDIIYTQHIWKLLFVLFKFIPIWKWCKL